MTIYAGTRPGEVERVLELIRREVKKMAVQGINREELNRTRNQMKGSLMLSLESSHSRMNKLAKDELIAGAHTSLEEMVAEIDAINEQQIDRVAQDVFDLATLSITGLGPFSPRQIAALS